MTNEKKWLMSFCALTVTALIFILIAFRDPVPGPARSSFYANETYIEGLFTPTDLADSMAVFRYIFQNLDEEITVYPSENYYYFRFTASGKSIWGSLSLSVESRDAGILGFGYIQKQDRYTGQVFEAAGGSKDLTDADGVIVKKVDALRYAVTFEGKTVMFLLRSLADKAPPDAILAGNERYAGPSFDESGMQFYLIYDRTEKHLFWILNEEENVPDAFFNVSDDIIVGIRTGFAFYLDTAYNRKILVGVDGYNALMNNWCDGPFDQLPDNDIQAGRFDIQQYIESAYSLGPGSIDKYGHYTYKTGIRVAIAPYFAYYSLQELEHRIDACKSQSATRTEFIACITEQIYYLPE